MEYNFREIEQRWQQLWKQNAVYKVSNDTAKPKFYVLDMFPYPSGAGLHVGHPLGYIASDIYSRYKRLKGFNVLHPMGFDSFGLPAEQYALETGQHPAVTTEKNIETFKSQLNKIGFCYDWSREVRTSDPAYYHWTQWIFLQLFESYFCNTQKKAMPIADLVKKYETHGNKNFTAEEWKGYHEKQQQDILMQRRLAFSAYGEVNWCQALGTVLANDEVVNGVSERGGHPVVKKKMRQWYLRITAYADRLLEGLETVNFSDAMKEMQRNWIGKSSGSEMTFSLTPNPSPEGEGNESNHHFQTADKKWWGNAKELSRENRKEQTAAEKKLWNGLRNDKLGFKVRRQHVIGTYIVDFAYLEKYLLIEVDGEYHNDEEQKKYDDTRTDYFAGLGYRLIRFTNEEVENNYVFVLEKIREELNREITAPLSDRRGAGGEAIKVYTTRPDTIFGVDFLVLAPEHELVQKITTTEQREEIDNYLIYVKSRSDRERQSEEKQITGCFTGAYALNPFNGNKIPIWIAEYVLAGYGTGAIMAVPCGDQRDFLFAKHFNIPITNIIGNHYTGEEANPTKEAILENSGFMNGLLMKDAIDVAMNKIEELGIGKRKVNYKMRDAGFSRQRYWGEPFPIVWKDGVAVSLDENELPLELPYVETYSPGPEGEGPLANIKEWFLNPNPSPQVEKGVFKDEVQIKIGAALVPKYKVRSPMQFELAKQMRKDYTDAENHLWQLIRGDKMGVKFRRQHPIDAYIADFICLQKSLIVEVDGGYHETPEQKTYDDERSRILNEIGFKIIRFTNNEVLNDTQNILKKIISFLNSSLDLSETQTFDETEKTNELSHPSPLAEQGMGVRETSTMPGYAGSSWYFLRYMDPGNNTTFCDRKASDYWQQVDVYVGGTEHAVGHLLYSRMWTKFLFDRGWISFEEPFKKLVNQGMITGKSYFFSVEKSEGESLKIISYRKENSSANTLRFKYGHQFVDSNGKLLRKDFEKSNTDTPYEISWEINDEEEFIYVKEESEKMSKSKFNVDNPDDLVNKYGADTFRMYEMFLGPVEQSKPWDTKGIEGVHRFLKKLWRLFYDEQKGRVWTTNADDILNSKSSESGSPLPGRGVRGEASDTEWKVLHKTIKKIEQDTENFSFNTAVSAFMVCVNELTDLKCHKKEVLEKLLVLLVPYAPHITEELWHALGNEETILDAAYPILDEKYLVESSKEYPISINGKLRTTINISLDAEQKDVEAFVLENETVQKWLEGKLPKKIIFVKNKMVNVVI